MSADNWAICPRCLAKERARRAVQVAETEAAYGKVPVSEFEAMRARDTERLDADKYRTFREDYEVGIVLGLFSVSYTGECAACGLKMKFKASEPIPGLTVEELADAATRE